MKKTTSDKKYTLEAVACLGACSIAPVIKIGEEVVGNVKAKDIKKLLKKHSKQKEITEKDTITEDKPYSRVKKEASIGFGIRAGKPLVRSAIESINLEEQQEEPVVQKRKRGGSVVERNPYNYTAKAI